jgi:hypothetical protein
VTGAKIPTSKKPLSRFRAPRRHYDEATVLSAGLALESASEVLGQRPGL